MFQCGTWWFVNISSNLNCCSDKVLLTYNFQLSWRSSDLSKWLTYPPNHAMTIKYLGGIYVASPAGTIPHLHLCSLKFIRGPVARTFLGSPSFTILFRRRQYDNDYHDDFTCKLPYSDDKWIIINIHESYLPISISLLYITVNCSMIVEISMAGSPVTHAIYTFLPRFKCFTTRSCTAHTFCCTH